MAGSQELASCCLFVPTEVDGVDGASPNVVTQDSGLWCITSWSPFSGVRKTGAGGGCSSAWETQGCPERTPRGRRAALASESKGSSQAAITPGLAKTRLSGSRPPHLPRTPL